MSPTPEARARGLGPGAAGTCLVVVSAIATAALFLFVPPIPQPAAYHAFADQRSLLGVPHAGDVLSNAALVFAGLYGLRAVARAGPKVLSPSEASAHRVAFLGVLLTGFGSAYYHWEPSNDTLLWDRLPMSVTSGAMLAVVVGEFLAVRLGRVVLVPAVSVGIAGVLQWQASEARGAGDLRLYGLVQFLPALALALMLVLARPRHPGAHRWWGVLLAFGLAKAAEALDRPIFALTHFLSGHTAKHLLAGLAVCLWARILQRRSADPAFPATGPMTRPTTRPP